MKLFSSLMIGIMSFFSGVGHQTTAVVSHVISGGSSTQQVTLSQSQLESLAGDKYADGNLPLGDKKYVLDGPKKGYIYLCNATNTDGGGAQTAGSWIHGTTWNIKEKIAVQGNVTWQGKFSNTVSGTTRTLSGNDLPSHGTGIFPIQSTDPAYQYDHNPNSIKSQTFSDALPTNPTYSSTPNCMGGEAGVMLTGVALFNGFDAGYRDAAAYEVQDSCNGHPQVTGEYHYHSLSSCITDVNETTVIGYALDGFPITGPKVADNKFLTTDNLDECHGITSEITLDGKSVTMYHYVMTQDFPYSVSCFRGKPVSMQVISSHQHQGNQPSGTPNGQHGMFGSSQHQQNGSQQSGQMHTPPQEAITACSGQTTGASCSFTSPHGTISGTCKTPPGQTSTVCVPAGGGPQPPQNF